MSYFPLTEGHNWQYHIQVTSMGGTEQQKRYISSLAPQNIEGKMTYIHQSLTGTQLLYRHTDAGISHIGFLVPDGASLKNVPDEHLVLPASLEVGSEWESVVSTRTLTLGKPSQANNSELKVKIPVNNKIESVEDEIKVIAGKFRNCLHLHTYGFAFNKRSNYIGRVLVEIDQTNWYAPGVGLVKSILVETTTSDALSRGEIVMELESFHKS